MAGLTFDTGALIAAERGDRAFWAFWKTRLRRGQEATVPAPVLAQAWRGPRSARLASLLEGCNVEAFTEEAARRSGLLLGRSRTSDVVDACVVESAARRGDTIVTGDMDDIRRLLAGASSSVTVLDVARL